MLQQLWDIARYWSKIAFFQTDLHSTSPLGGARWNIAITFNAAKTRMVCIPDGENSLMKCWMSRQNTGVWQTDWQKYGQTDILRRHSPRCAWHRVVKINWLRTSCMVSITTVATWRTQTANFWTDFEQRIIDRAINERQNDYGPVSRLKDCISLSNSHCTLFRYKHCLLRLNG